MFSIRKRVIRAIRLLRPKPLILMYHRVSEPSIDPWGLAVSATHFDEQMALLRTSRSVMPMSELVDRYKRDLLPRDAVAVTFDDGYVDNLANAKPILNRHGLRATLFLTTATVGSRTEYWWDELARLILLNSDGIDAKVRIGAEEVRIEISPGGEAGAAGWKTWTGPRTRRQASYMEIWGKLRLRSNSEILTAMAILRKQLGSGPPSKQDLPMSSKQIVELLSDGSLELGGHTLSHPVLPSLSAHEQMREMAEGKAACHALSDQNVTGFAYPYGEFDEQSVRLARECGFEWACTTEAKGLGKGTDLFLLPRIQVMDWNGETFAQALRDVL